MNNKGFAVSGVLYTILLVFLSLLVMLLFDLQNKKSLLDELKADTIHALNSELCDAFGITFTKYDNTFNSETTSGINREVAVITDTDISDYIISVNEPANKTSGMVWLKLDRNSNININASNAIIPVYYLKQYINSKWVYKESYLHNGIEWTKISDNKYTDHVLNGTDPKLANNLIPVIIEDDGTVKKASLNDEWYSYNDKKWANAVILVDNTIYDDGVTIPEAKIQSYFVWIPRYRYKLWNTGTAIKNVHSIEIVFENKETNPSTGNQNGEWLTHPAFTSFDSNGFWVGKFETGYDGATTTAAAQVNSSDSSKIIIKSNVFSWRNITVNNIFLKSYNYQRSLDSHMMKNTEWGAVAYLSHSKYGINKEVNINNNSSYKTGYSALPSTDQQTYPGTYGDGVAYNSAYNTEIGYLASTTGNITGIYDMSGGTHEYMAAYRSGTMGSSGFTTTSIAEYDSKYFDVYNASSSVNSYQYRILGDATGEMGPFQNYLDGDNSTRWHNSWYADISNFIDSSYSWFHRGSYYYHGALAGQFYFGRRTGDADTSFGFRIVLTP